MRAAKLLAVVAVLALSSVVSAAPCPDADVDDFADCTVPGCTPGTVSCGDCDDSDPEVHPGAFEWCNHHDDDCVGGVDQGYATAVSGERHLDLRPSAGANLGFAVAAIGDVDGDEFPDFAVGAPPDDQLAWDAGLLAVYSGADRRVLWKAPWTDALSRLGTSLAGAGDLDGDGIPDILAGFPGDESIGLFSGVDGGLIAMCVGPGGGNLGDDHGVAVIGDLDGDGVTEIAGGAKTNNERLHHQGKVTVFRYDRATHACAVRLQLWDPSGAIYDNLGASVAGVGDLSGDGVPDVAAGEPGFAAAKDNSGAIAIFSGADGALLRRLTDPAAAVNDNLGIDVHGIEDLNGDGVADVAASTERRNSSEGEVILFSGADGTVLRRLTDASTMLDERLGNAIDVVPDVDGDGLDDILAGARYASLGGVTNCGRALVFSSGSGAILAVLEPVLRVAGGQFGWAVAGIGDVTRDGVPEFVTGAPYDGPATTAQCGSFAVLALESVCDTDGRSPFQGDCDDTDAALWSVPSEVREVRFPSGSALLAWTEPSDLGGTGAVTYDTLRAGSAAGFGSAACLETAGSDASTEDPELPGRGSAFFYLVRPVNLCGAGELGTWGALQWPREAAGCP